MTLKTAVIGVGSMGKNHARIYWELPNADLVGVADFNKDTANTIANKYGTKAYYDYKVLLDEAKPDAVTLAVPTIYHRDIALEIIDRGIPLLIEKPIAFTIEEGQSIIDAARKKNVKLMIGHIERFNPAIITLKEHINQGKLGRIFQMDAHRQGPFPARIADVGVVVDLAVHDLDVMYYLFSEPVAEVYSTMGSILEKCEFEDHAEIMTKFNSGITGMLEVNWLTPYKRRELEITGTDGIISIDYIDQSIDVFGKFAQDVHINPEEPLKGEIKSFLSSIINDEEPEITGEDGIYALRVVLAAMKSARDHSPVKINGDLNPE